MVSHKNVKSEILGYLINVLNVRYRNISPKNQTRDIMMSHQRLKFEISKYLTKALKMRYGNISHFLLANKLFLRRLRGHQMSLCLSWKGVSMVKRRKTWATSWWSTLKVGRLAAFVSFAKGIWRGARCLQPAIWTSCGSKKLKHF